VPPELAHIPPEAIAIMRRIAARRRPRHHGRLNPAGLGLAAVAALALIMGSNVSSSPDAGGPAIEQGWREDGVWYDGTPGGLALVVVEEVADATIQSVEQPRHEIPLGPSTVRIEVVGDDRTADVVVTSDVGDAQPGAVVLPFGAEVRLDERPDQFAVTASTGYGRGDIQCRVYADGVLVSIATGSGMVECRAEPAR
jgi:hypothetical protein